MLYSRSMLVTYFIHSSLYKGVFLVAQMVKNSPAMQETWVRSLGQEDPLEKEMATHFSILAWIIPWIDSLVGYSPRNCTESDTERLTDTQEL